MKKFFVFVAAALVAFGFTACNGNDPENADYQIAIDNITTKGAHIAVTPAEGVTGTYYWDVVEASEAAQLKTDDQVAAYFKDYFDYVIEYYTAYGYEVSYADLLLDAAKGMDEYEYTGLDANTEYVVFAIALDENIAAKGKAVRKEFKTLELTEDPVPADMTFAITAEDITFSGATVSVTPSNNEATYYWNVMETAELEGVSDDELCAGIKDNIEYMIELYGYFGYDLTFEDFLSKGPDAYAYDDLEPNTNYTVVAFAMGTLGTTAGAVAKYNFSTPELVAESEETLDFHDAQIIDYRDLDGSFMIVAAPADSSIVVALNPISDEFVGTFTMEDMDADYCALYDYVNEEKIAIADAEFTGVLNEGVHTYTGWFLAMNAVKYNFVFNVAADDTEADAAPARVAKKAQAKNELKNFKKGNLQKSGKFVSEKAFNR